MWKRKAEQYSEYTFDYIVDWLTSYEIYICIYVVNATDHIVICVCYQLRVTFMLPSDHGHDGHLYGMKKRLMSRWIQE
jgi:hypothetical protein